MSSFGLFRFYLGLLSGKVRELLGVVLSSVQVEKGASDGGDDVASSEDVRGDCDPSRIC